MAATQGARGAPAPGPPLVGLLDGVEAYTEVAVTEEELAQFTVGWTRSSRLTARLTPGSGPAGPRRRWLESHQPF